MGCLFLHSLFYIVVIISTYRRRIYFYSASGAKYYGNGRYSTWQALIVVDGGSGSRACTICVRRNDL